MFVSGYAETSSIGFLVHVSTPPTLDFSTFQEALPVLLAETNSTYSQSLDSEPSTTVTISESDLSSTFESLNLKPDTPPRVPAPPAPVYKMTCTEIWVAYYFSSRGHLPPTTQLIELDIGHTIMRDLEDVLDHVFHQGYVEARYRPLTWWQCKDGKRIKASQTVEDVYGSGVGKTPEVALKLIIEDLPPIFWFSYVYLHAKAETKVVSQRVKLCDFPAGQDRLANVTNWIFSNGYLPNKLRPFVQWQSGDKRKLGDDVCVKDILGWGEGGCEDLALALVIDAAPSCAGRCACHHHEHETHGPHTPHSPHHHHAPHFPHSPHTPHPHVPHIPMPVPHHRCEHGECTHGPGHGHGHGPHTPHTPIHGPKHRHWE